MEEMRDTTATRAGALRLARMREAEMARRRAEVELLAVVEEHARLTPSPQGMLVRGAEIAVPFGGDGTTPAGQFVVADVATALGMSESAAHSLIADAVEIVQRLPRTWERVVAGWVEPWRARRIARVTRQVSPEAAALVDARVSGCAEAVGPRVLARLVAAVALECGEAENLASPQERHVDVQTPLGSADGFIEGVTDTHSAALFDAELSRIAAVLKAKGDEDSLDERRAKAIGIMASPELHLAVVNGEDGRSSARPQLVLHVTMTDAALAQSLAGRDGSAQMAGRDGSASVAGRDGSAQMAGRDGSLPMAGRDGSLPMAERAPASRSPETPMVELCESAPMAERHRSLPMAERASASRSPEPVADAGRLGPQLLDTIRAWAGHSRVTVRPVIDAEALRPVDSYHVPTAMREAMEHRHRTCVFPWCDRPPHHDEADSDHIEPFRPGVLGQTHLGNLAPLCRYHHRLKTHGGWRYRALGPTTFVWTSRFGETFVRGPEGTHRVTDPVPALRTELRRTRRQANGGWEPTPLPPIDIRIAMRGHRPVPARRVLLQPRLPAPTPGGGDPPPF